MEALYGRFTFGSPQLRSGQEILRLDRKSFSSALDRLRKSSETTYYEKLLRYSPPRGLPISHHQNRGVWFTDAHLLSRRSNGTKLIHALHSTLPKCGHCVSLGDKWDFAWSVFRSVKRSIEIAVQADVALAKMYPHCKFYMVNGNHDDNEEYVRLLKEAANTVPNLSVHRHVLSLPSALFTHGDTVHWPSATIEDISHYRKTTYGTEWLPSSLLQVLDEVSTRLRLNVLVPQLFLEQLLIPRKVQAERILNFIRNIDPQLLKGVRKIYYGHTHKFFRNFEYEGYSFNNGGSHERGFKASLNRFTVKPLETEDSRCQEQEKQAA